MDSEAIFCEIRKWHAEDRSATLRRTLELGDLIVNAVIATGLTEYEVVRRVIELEGELAYGVSTYNRAARMARTFTRNQRRVLIAAGVSLARCEILAGEAYEGRRRIKIVSEIKSGKITAPWTAIEGASEGRRKRQPELGVHGISRTFSDSSCNPDNIVLRIAHGGEMDDEAIINAFRCLLSRLGRERATRLWEQAQREFRQ